MRPGAERATEAPYVVIMVVAAIRPQDAADRVVGA
jgi:hypothetical protein